MDNKMLIDADHPEETRVVVVRGNRVEEFDFEAENKKQLRGNIYLAKVTRVEPSLQAAFVDYGGNRHGFLAFSEIHPDYYQIPVADRQALLKEEARVHKENREKDEASDEADIVDLSEEADLEDEGDGEDEIIDIHADDTDADETDDGSDDEPDGKSGGTIAASSEDSDAVLKSDPVQEAKPSDNDDTEADTDTEASTASSENRDDEETADAKSENDDKKNGRRSPRARGPRRRGRSRTKASKDNEEDDENESNDEDSVELVGSEDALEEVPERKSRPRIRHYKIQEVIKRRQIILVQVVKEERGNKGAALTTYLSLAGRYSVLMPNTDRGGGISRKITNQTDRKRLRTIATDLDVPEGMGVILRTAGASRTKTEIRRDFEYLMRLWENVRDFTLKSSAPCLVYEEGSLLKRSIRDLYNKDIKQVVVSGEAGYREAKDFMRMLMPSHAKNVQPYKDSNPIFARFGVEAQLDAMFSPEVTLKSGGYIVINQTEALVAIDVNSGKSTRERSIEDTALATNMEAAEEVARQLRLRDLAGLVVIDFIDMEEKRNNRAVERKLKECLRDDRARIQVGRISHFGLLEMSRQRIRAGVLESTMEPCTICMGTGHVRAPSSVALYVLRAIEDYLIRGSKYNLTVRCRTAVSLYVLNHKRTYLTELEDRFGLSITLEADETLQGEYCSILRGEKAEAPRIATSVTPDMGEIDQQLARDAELDATAEAAEQKQIARDKADDEESEPRKPRRARRNRNDESDEEAQSSDETHSSDTEENDGRDEEGQRKKRRRRGRRGGRKDRGRKNEEGQNQGANDDSDNAEQDTETPSENAEEITAQHDNDPDSSPNAADEPRAADAEAGAKSEETATTQPELSKKAQPAEAKSELKEEKASETITRKAEPEHEAEETEKPKKPARSGWWQRRSFF